MVISLSEVKKIVKNLGERDFNNPEGAGVDLRLGSVYKITGGRAFIEADNEAGQGKRSGFTTSELYSYDIDAKEQDSLIIKPGEYYLVKTIESVALPLDVLADFRPRSTLFRSGLQLLTTLG